MHCENFRPLGRAYLTYNVRFDAIIFYTTAASITHNDCLMRPERQTKQTQS